MDDLWLVAIGLVLALWSIKKISDRQLAQRQASHNIQTLSAHLYEIAIRMETHTSRASIVAGKSVPIWNYLAQNINIAQPMVGPEIAGNLVDAVNNTRAHLEELHEIMESMKSDEIELLTAVGMKVRVVNGATQSTDTGTN